MAFKYWPDLRIVSNRRAAQMLFGFAPVGSVVGAWQYTENELHFKSQDRAGSPQLREKEILRYGAYFKGWCQAFGEHESIMAGESDNRWLIGENQVGLILPKLLVRQLNHEILLRDQVPGLNFCRQGVQIGRLLYTFENDLEKRVLSVVEQLFDAGPELHLYLTSHLLYGNGSRIFTISSKRPQSIIYRKIGTINVNISLQ